MATLLFATATLAGSLPTVAATPLSPSGAVREILNRPESQQDYATAELAFGRLIDSNADAAIDKAMIDRLVDASRQMAGPSPTDSYKLSATRQAIYVAGLWNYNRAFSYDLANPLGQNPKDRLLSTYIRTRKGNCVSMPILFLIVADRVGLKVHMAAAPLHLFVRYTDPHGVDHNLETTSGGHEARTEWYRQNLPMSDKAIASGVYMRTLSKRESVAEMAIIVLDYLYDQRRYQEAIEVADAILEVNPREAYAMVKKGSAYAGLMQSEFVAKYPNPALIPPTLRARYLMFGQQNEKAFKDAEALGWEPTR
jgi:regulator of sirC expression with transglutaminase-like and TPR domain